eukprot:scaffold49361_cov292-Isochrysis_galbana.AAC.2
MATACECSSRACEVASRRAAPPARAFSFFRSASCLAAVPTASRAAERATRRAASTDNSAKARSASNASARLSATPASCLPAGRPQPAAYGVPAACPAWCMPPCPPPGVSPDMTWPADPTKASACRLAFCRARLIAF